jgi:hypothetical protein
MHDIEPHFRWRDEYTAEQDSRSPFFGRTYSETEFSHQLYNFYLHPQWDEIGSSTLYVKLLYADYTEGYALIELIGEWNDVLHNDIMLLRQNFIDLLLKENVTKFVFFCDNLLNFYSDIHDDYYTEWVEEINPERGWIVLCNVRPHVEEELEEAHLYNYILFGKQHNMDNWRTQKPDMVYQNMEYQINNRISQLGEG